MKNFFMSMALCWALSVIIAAILLLFGSSSNNIEGMLVGTETEASSLSTIILQMRVQANSAQDIHEILVALISGSYDLYVACIRECIFLSVLYEFSSFLRGIFLFIAPEWLIFFVDAFLTPIATAFDPAMPDLEHVPISDRCEMCDGLKSGGSGRGISSSSGKSSSILRMRSRSSSNAHTLCNCDKALKPEDILVFDDTFGVVPKGVLEQFKKTESKSDFYDSDNDLGKALTSSSDLTGTGGGALKGKRKTVSKIPPVRYSESD